MRVCVHFWSSGFPLFFLHFLVYVGFRFSNQLEVPGNIYTFTAPDDATIGQVRFFVDDVRWRRESSAPYDLMGTEGNLALPFDTATLVEGTHVVTAVIVANDGSTETASAVFQMQNTSQWDIWLPLIIR